MRLNFAGVPEQEIREGIRRIGRAMGGQAGLLGALTGSMGPAAAPVASEGASPAPDTGLADVGLADVLHLPRRPQPDQSHRRRDQ